MFYTGSTGYLLLITSFIGIMMSVLMMIRTRPALYYYYGTNLLICSFTGLTLASIKIKWILLQFPHLFLTAQPLLYLIGPLCYFFVLFSVEPLRRLRKTDLLHLVPFLVHTIELTPFYLLDTGAKREVIMNAYGQGESIILPTFTFGLTYFQQIFLKALSILVYSSLALALIRKSFNGAMMAFREKNQLLYRWITFETLLRILLSLTGLLKAVMNGEYPLIDQFFAYILGLDTLAGIGFIMLNPRILEGLVPFERDFRQPITEDGAETALIVEETDLTSAAEPIRAQDDQEIKIRFSLIEARIQSTKPFLNEGFSRESLSALTGIPPRQLTQIIKSATGLSFSDYVNTYRLSYLKENAPMLRKEAKPTIDSIGLSIGFANRISFYNAVKQHRNTTPTELIRSLGITEVEN